MTLRILPGGAAAVLPAVPASALTLDALHADGLVSFDDGTDPWADPELAAELDRRADALREMHAADADGVDDHWMMDAHGGPAAVGRVVDGRLAWVPMIGRAL